MTKKKKNIILLILFTIVMSIGFIWMMKHEFPKNTDLYTIRNTIQGAAVFLLGGIGCIGVIFNLVNTKD